VVGAVWTEGPHPLYGGFVQAEIRVIAIPHDRSFFAIPFSSGCDT